MFAASSEPSAEPAPIERVDLVDEDDHVVRAGELGDDPLEALLELTAVLRPGHDERQVEREDPLAEEVRRNLPVDDPAREPLDDRRLADARIAEQHGLFLRRRESTWTTRSSSSSRPIERIEDAAAAPSR